MSTGVSTIPQWHTFMRPVLEALSSSAVLAKRDMENAVIASTGLDERQRLEQLDSGQLRSLNRIGWATSALRVCDQLFVGRFGAGILPS